MHQCGDSVLWSQCVVEKRIAAELIEGSPALFLDNLNNLRRTRAGRSVMALARRSDLNAVFDSRIQRATQD